MKGIKFLHSNGIIHRDLKPSNIAVTEATFQIKILDFGMARLANPDSAHKTGYVTTRFYRAPEVILQATQQYRVGNYTEAIDVWSVGCILGEFLSRGRIIFPGRQTAETIIVICNLIGKPGPEYIEKIVSNSTRAWLNKLPASLVPRYACPGVLNLAYNDGRKKIL